MVGRYTGIDMGLGIWVYQKRKYVQATSKQSILQCMGKVTARYLIGSRYYSKRHMYSHWPAIEKNHMNGRRIGVNRTA